MNEQQNINYKDKSNQKKDKQQSNNKQQQENYFTISWVPNNQIQQTQKISLPNLNLTAYNQPNEYHNPQNEFKSHQQNNRIPQMQKSQFHSLKPLQNYINSQQNFYQRKNNYISNFQDNEKPHQSQSLKKNIYSEMIPDEEDIHMEENLDGNDPQDSIKLKIRSQLIRRSRKYQISTNNAHKKYINCLKNLFYQALSQQQITQFEKKYIKQKSSRVFFFIILVYVKYRFTSELGKAVKLGFQKQMNERIKQYQQQIYRCSDFMLKNYRYEQIHEIEIALKAIDEYYLGNTDSAIQYLYRKDKHIIVKQNHFRTSLKIIQELQIEFSKNQQPLISKPFVKDNYHKKIAYKSFDKDNMLSPHQNIQSIKQKQQIGPQISKQKNIQEQKQQQNMLRSQIENNQIENKSQSSHQDENLLSNIQEGIQSQKKHLQSQNQEQISHAQSQIINQEGAQSYLQISKQNQIHRQIRASIIQPSREKQLQNQQVMQQILFPPIPPYFYLPDFDQKYGYLFRKLVYIKSWRDSNQNERFNQDITNKNYVKNGMQNHAPPPLVFGSDFFFVKKKI